MSVSTNSSQQAGRARDETPTLKARLAELERQANEYKTKIDQLNRAKAPTTVVKTEREYVNTTGSGTSRTEKIKCDKCEELERTLDGEKKSNAQLKKLAEQKDNSKKPAPAPAPKTSGPCPNCPHSQELIDLQKETNLEVMDQLMSQEKWTADERKTKEAIEKNLAITQSQLVEVKHRCEKLEKENREYQSLCEKMKKEYADKMAELCRQEEEAKKQVATWEQMYSEWMSTMEKRVNTLQVTNQEFNTLVRDESQMDSQRRTGGTGNQRR